MAEIYRGGAGLVTSAFNVKKLASGAAISSMVSFTQAGGSIVAHGTINGAHQGEFSSGIGGFAGVDFKTGTGLDQKTYYGWVRLKYTNSNNVPNSITAIDWAYEATPGAAIHAGDTGISGTPEPGTAALSLLALGAAGVLALRRRGAGKSV